MNYKLNQLKINQNGFTLIELMVVVSIMGILATLALPSYQDRIIKTQVQEGILLADFVKQDVSAYYAKNKKMPENNSSAALPPSDKIIGNYVTDLSVEQGTIIITYGNRSNKHLAGKKISLRPAIVEGYPVVPITWVCGMASAPEKMKITGNNMTNIAQANLPLDCAK